MTAKLINKLTGRESTQPQDMKPSQIVGVDKICTNLRQLLGSAGEKQIIALVDIQTNIYCFYLEFITEDLENEYLAITDDSERAEFLNTNEGGYTESRDLHPNMKLAYNRPGEHDLIIDYIVKLEASVEAGRNLPADFFNAINRMDNQQ